MFRCIQCNPSAPSSGGKLKGSAARLTPVESKYFTKTSGLPPWYITPAEIRPVVVLYGAIWNGYADGGRGPWVVGPHPDRLTIPGWVNRLG